MTYVTDAVEAFILRTENTVDPNMDDAEMHDIQSAGLKHLVGDEEDPPAHVAYVMRLFAEYLTSDSDVAKTILAARLKGMNPGAAIRFCVRQEQVSGLIFGFLLGLEAQRRFDEDLPVHPREATS